MSDLKKSKRVWSITLAVTIVLFAVTNVLLAYTMQYNFTAPRDPGWPTFSGAAAPAEPVAYTVNNMMQAIYDSEKNGTSFWIDRMLDQVGNNPDTNDLFSRGRMLLLAGHDPSVMGFAGEARYGDRVNDPGKNIYTVTLSPGSFSENVSLRNNCPSYFSTEFNSNTSINVKETKFITYNNVAVTLLAIKNNGSSTQNITITVNSPYATSASGSELVGTVAAPLLWTGFNANYISGVTNCYVRMSGDSMTVSGSNLVRTISIAPGQTIQTKVLLGWSTPELPESTTEYNTFKSYNNDTAFADQVQTYNKWWVDNIPYIDVPDSYIKKVLYYRWWINRFDSIDGNIPGNDWQFPAPVEGALGYANQITVSMPWIMDDIKYLRNPIYAYGAFLTAGEETEVGAYRDNPARGWMWNKIMMQYISKAGWEGYKVHGGPLAMLKNFTRYAENDINGQFNYYDQNNNKLLAYSDSTLTGNDGCLPSMQYYSTDGRERNTERIDASAYNYGNTVAAAQMYSYMVNSTKASQMNSLASTIQTNFLNYFWDEGTRQFLHFDTGANARDYWKDNNFNGYWMGIIPTNDPKYREMFNLFNNNGDYFVFPFFTGDYKDIDARYNKLKSTGQFDTWYANTFGYCNGGVNLSVLAAAIKKYPNSYITADTYKKTLYWDAWLHCIQDGNADYLDANEFYWLENTNNDTKVTSTMQQTGRIVRSWIHHNQLGKMNSNVIEDVMGFTPREDTKIELWPIDIGWDHFTVNNLRYHGSDITIVWDKPGDGKTYYGSVPEGYSLYINGTRMFTINALSHVIWNAQTGSVTLPEGGATVSYNVANTAFNEAKAVTYTDSRLLDIFQKAGRDISGTTEPVNLAENANKTGYPTPSASYTASGTDVWGAVDGYTIARPIWGTKGSPNAQDWYQIDFGTSKTISSVKLYFYNDRCNPGYSEPVSYTVQYLNGSTWVDAPSQVKNPTAPWANYNLDTFTAVTAQKIRVLVTHKSSSLKTGLKEVQVFGSGTTTNQAPVVEAGNNQTITYPASASLSGTVTDDGLPNGALTTAWSVDSGPGAVTFSNANALSTTASFSEAGTYVLRLTASDGALSSYDTVTITVNPAGTSNSYEAESSVNTIAGAAVISNVASASGGQVVGYIGNGTANYLQFNNVNVSTAGSYTLRIYYISGENRNADMSINGGSATTLSFTSTGDWSTVSMKDVTISLSAGNNTIKFSNATAYAPDFDKITVSPVNTNPDVAWYKFDETSGTTASDSSGNGNNGTLNAGATWAAGKSGNAVSLNGSNGYISLPAGIVSGLNDFTIAAWVKPNSISTWNRIFDFGTGTNVYMFLTISTGTVPRFAITTSSNGAEQQINGTSALATGVWTHVALTLSGTTGTLYINGAQVAQNTNITLKPSSLGSTNRNYIGKSQWPDPYLNGYIDDFRIYSRALSASEIQNLTQ